MLAPAKAGFAILERGKNTMVQGLSINTNPAAFVALQQLNKTNKLLNHTRLKITSGLKVNGLKMTLQHSRYQRVLEVIFLVLMLLKLH